MGDPDQDSFEKKQQRSSSITTDASEAKSVFKQGKPLKFSEKAAH